MYSPDHGQAKIGDIAAPSIQEAAIKLKRELGILKEFVIWPRSQAPVSARTGKERRDDLS